MSSKINIFTYWQKKGDRVLVWLLVCFFVFEMGYYYVAQADASKTKYVAETTLECKPSFLCLASLVLGEREREKIYPPSFIFMFMEMALWHQS